MRDSMVFLITFHQLIVIKRIEPNLMLKDLLCSVQRPSQKKCMQPNTILVPNHNKRAALDSINTGCPALQQ